MRFIFIHNCFLFKQLVSKKINTVKITILKNCLAHYFVFLTAVCARLISGVSANVNLITPSTFFLPQVLGLW